VRLVHLVTASLLFVPITLLAQHSPSVPSSSSTSTTHSSPPAPPPASPTSASSSSISSSPSISSSSSTHSISSDSGHSPSPSHSIGSSGGGATSSGGHGSGASATPSSSRDTHSTTSWPSTRDTQTGAQPARHVDLDREARRPVQDSVSSADHGKIRSAEKASDATPSAHPKLETTRDTPRDVADIRHKNCEKEPCSVPAPKPEVYHGDWRPGSCKEGPCESYCPTGTTPGRGGACVTKPTPATAAAAAQRQASWPNANQTQCTLVFSETTRVETDLTWAKMRTQSACLHDQGSTECTFARMDEDMARQRCEMVFVPTGCNTRSPICL
jgi:hypothetical protein